MVVAVLVNRYAPSSRGLQRRAEQESGSSQWASTSDLEDQANSQRQSTGHRLKPFKAIHCLTSLASDFNLISDWMFYFDCVGNDEDYRAEGAEEMGSRSYLIPPMLLWATLFTCICGTFMWLILATDGRLIAPLLRRLGYDKLSIGHMLFISVVLEDFPQVVLTFLIEDYYEGDSLSNLAVVNVTVSLYDTLIKIAEAYDERHDVVETGHWCKESLWAHHDSVTSILSVHLPPSTVDLNQSMNSSRSILKSSLRRMPKRSEGSLGNISKPAFNRSIRRRGSTSVLDEALMPIAPLELPRLRFLTTSLDKTVRLWDTVASLKGHRRDKCIRVFRGHSAGVTCIALLGKADTYDWMDNPNLDYRDEEDDHTTFFLSGSKDGDIKLWNLYGACLRTYGAKGTKGVTDVSAMREGSTFVSAHGDGTARLWEVWSGLCLGIFKGHSRGVTCLCSMKDRTTFVTGSKDTTLKLWDTSDAMDTFRASLSFSQDSFDSETMRRIAFATDQPVHEELVCARAFVHLGETSEILSVVCLEEGAAIVAGSADGIARIWAVESGACLRVFVGHTGPVRCIEAFDRFSILTGSQDKTVRLWDAISGDCLRIYEDHTDFVSSISRTYDEHTFLTASGDRTCKIWQITSVQKKRPEQFDDNLEDILAESNEMYVDISTD